MFPLIMFHAVMFAIIGMVIYIIFKGKKNENRSLVFAFMITGLLGVLAIMMIPVYGPWLFTHFWPFTVKGG